VVAELSRNGRSDSSPVHSQAPARHYRMPR